MVNVNDFICASDNDTIERAIAARGADGIVVIPPRVSKIEPERTKWLLDRAILLPANTTVVLQNVTIQLSDACRDNFFRSANCGIGIEDPQPIENIHIRGEGLCTLLGAEHPRAVGDGSKILANPCPYTTEDLCRFAPWIPEDRRTPETIQFWDRHDHSFGTDAGKEGESQYGDWRGIGVLLANVKHFSIKNLRIVDSHGWAISLEACSYGRVEQIEFDATMSKWIDGMLHNMENQDGVDIRNGCHHIVVTDISGRTGDDIIALTAVAGKNYLPGGSMRTTHVMHNDWSRRERDIHDVIIRNVNGHSNLCWMIRLLPVNAAIYNVVIDGVLDTTPEGIENCGALLLGENDEAYGANLPDCLRQITVSNVVSAGYHAINIGGYLTDSVITNVVYRGKLEPVRIGRENGLKNVVMSEICCTNR